MKRMKRRMKRNRTKMTLMQTKTHQIEKRRVEKEWINSHDNEPVKDRIHTMACGFFCNGGKKHTINPHLFFFPPFDKRFFMCRIDT